ncbi:MAG: winged helix-turn-helix transcriptional regulator [Candidatus Thermoplasmatota archaeon]|nr:winged helix-turn-helix transcriptional regulator [Candidatus Thermoplasmatota archaeon]
MTIGHRLLCSCIIVCIIFSAFSGCISSDLPLLSTSQDDGAKSGAVQFIVPYSRLGDWVAYGITETADDSDEEEDANSGEEYDDEDDEDCESGGFPVECFQIGESVVESCDQFMNRHRAYAVDATFNLGLLSLFCSTNFSYNVDLDSNKCLSAEYSAEGAFGLFVFFAAGKEKSVVFEPQEYLLSPYMEFQGKTIIGDGKNLEDENAVHCSERARINGQDCLGYKKEFSEMGAISGLVGPLYSLSDYLGGSTWSGSSNGDDGQNIQDDEVSGFVRYWLNPTSPYPVLIEVVFDSVSGDGLEEIEDASSISFFLNYAAGKQEIPFDSCRCGGVIRDRGVMDFTSWNGFAPADGAGCGSEMDFTLGEALDSIESDVLSIEFKNYVSSHPDAYLQSATYSIENESSPVSISGTTAQFDALHNWHLIFSDFGGNGFEINSTVREISYTGTLLPPVNSYDGEIAAYAIPKEGFPKEVPTIMCAIEAWKEFASLEYAQAGINFVSWGIPGDCYPGNGTLQSPDGSSALDLFKLRAGYYFYGGEYYIAPGDIGKSSCSNESIACIDIAGKCIESFDETMTLSAVGSSSPSGFSNWIEDVISRYSMSQMQMYNFAATKENIALGAGALSFFALLAYLWPGLKWAAGKGIIAPFYARFHGEGALENKVRDRILGMIKSNPGASMSDIMREAGLSWSSAVYHLTVLERESHIVSVRKGRERMFFPKEKSRMEYERDAVLKNLSTAQIYKLIQKNPGIIQKYISEEMGMKHPSVNWHIGRLKEAGLVREERAGRSTQYFPNGGN